MEPEIIILGMEYCGVCQDIKDQLKKEIKAGKYRYVDIDSPEGEEFDKKFNVKSTPYFLKLKKDGTYKKCGMYEKPDGTHFFR